MEAEPGVMSAAGTVAIVDYGLGNLRSVAGAVGRLGYSPIVTADPHALAAADKIILPGVGAFGDGMRNLHERRLVDPLTELVQDGKLVLGLCLGMQLMFSESEEFGQHEGLGWIEGIVRRIPQNGVRIPHVGWNDLQRTGDTRLFDDLRDEPLFYYVHSFWTDAADAHVVKGTCDYGRPLPAVIESNNVYGTQFHPEKSQLDGLTILANFLALS